MHEESVKLPLSRKIAIMVSITALTLSAVLIIASYVHYKNEMYGHYEDFAMSIGAMAASQLNPDRIQHYLDTGEIDEEYEQAYDTLCDLQQNGNVMYLYVVKPELGEVWYVLDTDQSEEAIPLGYHEPYYEGEFADNAEKMARGEYVEPLVSNEEYGWLMSVYYPMKTSSGEPAGYVGVDILMNEVMNDLRRYAVQMIGLMVLLTTVVSAILFFLSRKTIAEPIKKLSSASATLVEKQSGTGEETAIFENLTIRSKDEVGVLYRSLSRMEKDMNAYIRDLVSVTAEKERIGTELNVATQIQADMLPRTFPAFPQRDDFDIYASMTPAKEVGGDFYDFFFVDDDHLAMVMADVSGKGVPAALFMVIAKTLIKNRTQMGGTPSEILADVNAQLCEGNEAGLFVTVWLSILELSTGKGMAANAGHEHPAVRRGDGTFELIKYRHSPAVATMEGIPFREHEFELHKGDALYVYTDGVTEATDKNNQLFGEDRLVKALNREPDACPQKILENVKEDIDIFVGEAVQFDDITMMCIDLRSFRTNDSAELEVDAKVENLPKVLTFIGAELEKNDCSAKTKTQIDIAVEELFVNIAHYAYPEGDGWAKIRADVKDGEATISFTDGGVPYDPLAKPDPDVTLSAEERQIGGLGIYMVKQQMDDMQYERKGDCNVVTIRKDLKKSA